MFYFPRVGHWMGKRRSYAVDEGAMARKGVRQVSEEQHPQAEIDRLCKKGQRAIAWQRQLRPRMFSRAAAVSAGMPGNAHQADGLHAPSGGAVPLPPRPHGEGRIRSRYFRDRDKNMR
jgi:hypothetical protein